MCYVGEDIMAKLQNGKTQNDKLQNGKAQSQSTKKPTKAPKTPQSQNPGSSFPKPLNSKEEAHFIELYTNGNPKEKEIAKNTLIERNLRLVAHIVKKFHHQDIEDLISIGTIGLIKGIASFDSQKGVRLATYCSRCIENAICFCVMRITPFKHFRKICGYFAPFEENMGGVALDDYTFKYTAQELQLALVVNQLYQPREVKYGLLGFFNVGKLAFLGFYRALNFVQPGLFFVTFFA
jgi:RNA polymerase sporulation-specific sigma factor